LGVPPPTSSCAAPPSPTGVESSLSRDGRRPRLREGAANTNIELYVEDGGIRMGANA
jgi:hypothetical protein